MASNVDSTSALRTSRTREAPSATRSDVCERSFNPRARMRFARLPQATRSTQPGDEQQRQTPFILIAHGGDAGPARNQVKRLLRPRLFFARLHVRYMAGEPIMELDAELGFHGPGIHAGTHAAEDVEPVRVWPLKSLGLSVK